MHNGCRLRATKKSLNPFHMVKGSIDKDNESIKRCGVKCSVLIALAKHGELLDFRYFRNLLVVPALTPTYRAKINGDVTDPRGARSNGLDSLIRHRSAASGTGDVFF